MAGPRNLPPRSSQRRGTNEEPPMRTRSGREPKPVAKLEQRDMPSPKPSSQAGSQVSLTSPLSSKKPVRAASINTNYATLDAGSDIYAIYEKPIFTIVGIPPDFFTTLQEPETPPKESRALDYLLNYWDDHESASEMDSDQEQYSPHPTPRGRGRGGRGSRGGRPRGGRAGRGGRGGRPRGSAASTASTTSPLRTRPSRHAAPTSLVEEDDEPSNQASPADDAKESPDRDEQAEDPQREAADDEDYNAMEDVKPELFVSSVTPPGSPPPELIQAYRDPHASIPASLAVPKISIKKSVSRTQTPREGTVTPAVIAAPKPLSSEEDALSDSDLPGPWVEGLPSPIEAECEDRADYLLQKRYKPLVDVQDIIASLTKHSFSQRSTESLYAMAENTQRILRAWQDEYLELDARTAPHSHPPKKPCNGGRIPVNPAVFEDIKESEIYGYVYDPKKPEAGMQNPFTQRPGHEKSGGRELRQRRARDMLDSAAPSEDEDDEDESRSAKRQRRATRRFDGSEIGTGANTPRKNNGWGGARKKGVSKYSQNDASVTPEPVDVRGKRGRGLLHSRIQQIYEESAVASSGDEGSNTNSVEEEELRAQPAKRGGGRGRGRGGGQRAGGRPAGKGLKKRMHDDDSPIPSAPAQSGPPPALQSLSEGQNTFTLDGPVGTAVPPPVVGPHSTETVFQATPQPLDTQEIGPPTSAHTPDTYMNTTPLSQYSNPYDDSANNSASGSRKKPRVKSEKRSQSMTIWWAERKARQKEIDEKNGTPPKQPTSRSTSGAGKRGGRNSAAASPGARPLSDPHHYRPISYYPDPHGPPPHQQADLQAFHSHPPPQHSQPYSAPAPVSMPYAPIPMTYPPPPSMVLQPTPLAALPTTIPPPPAPGRALAPAPVPAQISMSYPSPYGPRTIQQPKKSGPPPLAPAPPSGVSHVSPYGPLGSPISAGSKDMPFKVMVPGAPPDSRRSSRG